MSSINSRVPPLRLMAVDTPSDGQLPAYQSSSGKFEWVDDSSGGSPGGSNNEIQFNNSGAFGGDAGFIMNTKGGGGSTIIRVGNLLVGAAKISAATTNGFTYIQSDGSGQIFLQSSADGGGTFSDTVVNIAKNSASDSATLKFRDSLTQEATIVLDGSGNLDITNAQNNQNIEMSVKGTGQVEVKQATSNTDSNLLIRGNGTGTPKITFTNDTKSITIQCDENNKLKVQGALHDFIFDCSSSSGGITFPDGTTQTTAAAGVSYPLTGTDGSSSAPTYSFSADTNTGMYRIGDDELGFAAFGNEMMSISALGTKIQERMITEDGSTVVPSISFISDTNTGMYRPGSDEIAFTLGSSRMFDFRKVSSSAQLRFRGTTPIISCDSASADLSLRSGGGTFGEINIGNENDDIEIKPAGTGKVKISAAYTLPSADGSANQVLATNGSGALSFVAAGGGGGNDFNLELPGTDLNSAANNLYMISRQPGWGSNYSGSGTLNASEDPRFWPWISPVTGDMKCLIDVTADGTGVLGIAIYSDNEGVPSSKIGGEYSYTFGSTGTGVKELTPASTVSVTRGTQYWIGVVETTIGNGAIRAENSTYSYNVAPVSGTLTSFSSIGAAGVRLTNSDNTLPASITASDLSTITQGQLRWGAKFG